uniref:Uncharacterized protein n=1 Tax=Rhizophora mucronata TaxID=61149 RepID=A0A2P2PYI1_RHIMU
MVAEMSGQNFTKSLRWVCVVPLLLVSKLLPVQCRAAELVGSVGLGCRLP